MERFGNFSSSSIHKLTTVSTDKKSFGKPALTYIKQKKREKLLGRSLQKDAKSKPLLWGRLCESFVFSKLDLMYKLESKIRYQHKTISNWNGMPDTLRNDVVGDIKCPFTLDSFCDLVEACSLGYEEFKKESPEYFWQLISNAILTDSKKIELIVYCPYLEDLQEIRILASDNLDYKFLDYADNDELPYLIKGNHFKDLNIFEFDIEQKDIDFLTEKVSKAVELLK